MRHVIPVYTVHVPDYTVDREPDYRAIGSSVDAELKKHFMGQTIGVRGLGSQEHPGKNVDELVEIIRDLGTDRYDPQREGDRHANIEGKQIDLHILRRTVSERSQIFWQLAWSFYAYPLRARGVPVKVDILVVYNIAQLKAVRTTHSIDGKADRKQDGHVFRDPANKPAAVRAIFKILS